MTRLSDALQSIFQSNPFLEFGFHHRLFNLTQLANYLRPFVQARLQKDVSISALKMSLSRLQQTSAGMTPELEKYHIEKISLVTGLCTATFAHSPQAHKRLNALYNHVQNNSGFCSLSEGVRELTMIVESRYAKRLLGTVDQAPLYTHAKLTSISVQFGESYAEVHGMLYLLLQRVALQNVNLIEISSTYTEIAFYVADKDARIVFDTLYQSFLIQDGVDE